MKHFLHMRWKNILYASLFLLLIVNMTATGVNAQFAQIYVDPPQATISAVGETITIAINVSDVSDLYGYDLWVHYDNTILNVPAPPMGVTVVGPGQVVPINPNQYSFMDKSVPGTVKIVVSFLRAMGAVAFNGNGTLCWITFNGTALGVSDLEIEPLETFLYDSNAFPIPAIISGDGEITVIPEFPAALATPLLLIAALAATFLGKIVWSRKRRGPAIT